MNIFQDKDKGYPNSEIKARKTRISHIDAAIYIKKIQQYSKNFAENNNNGIISLFYFIVHGLGNEIIQSNQMAKGFQANQINYFNLCHLNNNIPNDRLQQINQMQLNQQSQFNHFNHLNHIFSNSQQTTKNPLLEAAKINSTNVNSSKENSNEKAESIEAAEKNKNFSTINNLNSLFNTMNQNQTSTSKDIEINAHTPINTTEVGDISEEAVIKNKNTKEECKEQGGIHHKQNTQKMELDRIEDVTNNQLKDVIIIILNSF